MSEYLSPELIRGVGARTVIAAGRRQRICDYTVWDPFVNPGDPVSSKTWTVPAVGACTVMVGDKSRRHVTAYAAAAALAGDGLVTLSPSYGGVWKPPRSTSDVAGSWSIASSDDDITAGLAGDIPRLHIADDSQAIRRFDRLLADRANRGWYNTMHIMVLGNISDDMAAFLGSHQENTWQHTGVAVVIAGETGHGVSRCVSRRNRLCPDIDHLPQIDTAKDAGSDEPVRIPQFMVNHGTNIDTLVIDDITRHTRDDKSWTWATLRHVGDTPCAEHDNDSEGAARPESPHGIIATQRRIGLIVPDAHRA